MIEEDKKIKKQQYAKNYYLLNKEKFAKNSRKYRNTDKGKLALERARKKERDNLSDNYIRQNLYAGLYLSYGVSLDRKSVSQEHIDKLRKILLAKREVKCLKYENKC